MSKNSKAYKAAAEKVDRTKLYSPLEALALAKETSSTKMDDTVEVAMRLGVDSRKADQMVRGTVNLPHGTGKSVRVAVFTQGANAESAKAAGADLIGMEDLAEQIKSGIMDFDVVIAEPAAMRVVGQLGQILGPRGLMPNPKTGTVTPDVATAVKNAKAGQVRFRADKGGIIHGGIGRVSFDSKSIKENLEALVNDLKKAKPSSSKGIYLKKISLSTTMGPGLNIDLTSLEI